MKKLSDFRLLKKIANPLKCEYTQSDFYIWRYAVVLMPYSTCCKQYGLIAKNLNI